MYAHQLTLLKRWVRRFWVFSPERLWLLSIRLANNGHWILAFWLKQLSGFLYANTLSPRASVSPDIQLPHNSLGVGVTPNVVIGRRVIIWHHATLLADRPARPSRTNDDEDSNGGPPAAHGRRWSRIIIEDDVVIGIYALIAAPRGRDLRIGRGARIGVGALVTKDVPAGAIVVAPSARVLIRRSPDQPYEEVSQADGGGADAKPPETPSELEVDASELDGEPSELEGEA